MSATDHATACGALWGTALFTGLFFGLLGWWMCAWGASVYTPDSVSYLRFAQTGQVRDLPFHHGIGYPVALRVMGRASEITSPAKDDSHFGNKTGFDGIRIVTRRFTAFCFFAAGMVLCLWMGMWFGPKGVLCTWIALSNYAWLEVFSRTMSEGLFLLCLVVSYFALWRYSRSGRKSDWLLSAIVMACACLTRYAGLAFVAASALFLILLGKHLRKGLGSATLYAAICILPLSAVLVWNRMLHGSATNRLVAVHWPGWNQLSDAGATIVSWLVPDRIWLSAPWLCPLAAVATVATAIWMALRGMRSRAVDGLFCLLPVLSYLVFLAFCFSFFDANIPFDRRMLSPLVLFGVLSLALAWKRFPARWLRVGIGGIVVWVLLFNAIRAVPFVTKRHRDGEGYFGRAWSESAFVAHVEELQAVRRIYVGSPTGFRARGCRNVLGWVQMSDSNTLMANTNFLSDYSAMLDDLADGALLADLRLEAPNSRLVPLDTILRDSGLPILAKYPDGTLFGKP